MNGVGIAGRVLENVKPSLGIERQPGNDAEAYVLRRDFSPVSDLHDLRRAIFNGKRVEVTHEQVVAIVGEGGRNDCTAVGLGLHILPSAPLRRCRGGTARRSET